MRYGLVILTASLAPTIAFLSVAPKLKHRVTVSSSYYDGDDDDDDDDDVPILQQTLDPSSLPRTLDPSSLQQTLDPSSLPMLQQTLDPSSLQQTLDPNLPMPIDPMQEQQPALIETYGGGTTMIMEMARRMLVWDDSERKSNNLPRWHPHSGVSDVNPSFRTQSPIMNNQGYAMTIWRNVRKRNKPSMWRYALRTYDRMEEAANDTRTSALRIERNQIHHEGALQACAKLGLWIQALEIFESVREEGLEEGGVGVTDDMVFSLVKACVRGCKKLKGSDSLMEVRRAPLDAAAALLTNVDSQDFPLVARYLNPLASAYQSLGLDEDARSLLQTNLGDRSIGLEPENGRENVNVPDESAKDKASYALLVKGAIASGSWANAVEALEDMTDAGLYPSNRHLNQWTEVSERKTSQRGSKKKRDEYWLESVG